MYVYSYMHVKYVYHQKINILRGIWMMITLIYILLYAESVGT